MRVCAQVGAGVDAASAPELVHALSCGVRGSDIVVTGPAKSEHLLWLAARHGCLIAVDALDELDRVIALAHRGESVRIMLRVLPEVNPHSRFGLNPTELDAALQQCAQQRSRVSMEGFSFHLNGYEVAPRAQLAAQLVDRVVEARAQGLAATSISIGGGFAVSYLDAETWDRFCATAPKATFTPAKRSPTSTPIIRSRLGPTCWPQSFQRGRRRPRHRRRPIRHDGNQAPARARPRVAQRGRIHRFSRAGIQAARRLRDHHRSRAEHELVGAVEIQRVPPGSDAVAARKLGRAAVDRPGPMLRRRG